MDRGIDTFKGMHVMRFMWDVPDRLTCPFLHVALLGFPKASRRHEDSSL